MLKLSRKIICITNCKEFLKIKVVSTKDFHGYLRIDFFILKTIVAF